MKFFKVIGKIIIGALTLLGGLFVGGVCKAAYEDRKIDK